MKGVLLVNLGSPESPTAKDVKPYLDEFLMDKFVIDVPYLLRALLDCPVTAAPQAHGDWALTTHLAEHLQTLQDMGAMCAPSVTGAEGTLQYVPFV